MDKRKYYLTTPIYYANSRPHVGSAYTTIVCDVIARYKRMCGYDVLHPMGWDAFGLPAEQHALATGTHPRDTTAANVATFRRQLDRLGFAYDWSREINTTSPDYVRWTQSQAFGAGHQQAEASRPHGSGPAAGNSEIWSFDVLQSTGPAS